MSDRKKITPEQLEEYIEKHGEEVAMQTVRAEANVVVLDKDGNVKSELKFSTENIQENNDAVGDGS